MITKFVIANLLQYVDGNTPNCNKKIENHKVRCNLLGGNKY